MKQILAQEDVGILADVKVKLAGRTVTVTGPRGTLTKNFDHTKLSLKMIKGGSAIRAEIWFGTRADIACCRTIISHIKNMMIGVTKGFLYRMKLAYNHFPISVAQEGNNIEIRNFVGEKIVRTIRIREGVTFTKPTDKDLKDEIILSGNDVDAVSQTCADIHTSTLVRNKDIRCFLDGIYISSRGNVVQEE